MAPAQLYDKLWTGLGRIVDGKPQKQDTRLLSVSGGVVAAVAALAGAQAKLLQLERLAQPAETPMEFARKLREAQRAMEAMAYGMPDPAPDEKENASETVAA